MKYWFSIFGLISFALTIHAQGEQKAAILEKYNIELIEGYVFESASKLDSFLITREYYNEKGRRTKIEIHKREGIGCVYSYTYLHDTIKTERLTDCNGKILRTEIYYDNKNREIGAVDFEEDGTKSGTYSTTIYNDKKRTKETKIYFSNKLVSHSKTKYDVNNDPLLYSTKRKGKWKHFIPDNGMNPITYTTENYDGTGLKLIRKTDRTDENRTILAINGKLKLMLDDMLVTENYLNSNGLLEYQIQLLNEKFVAMKKYKYKARF